MAVAIIETVGGTGGNGNANTKTTTIDTTGASAVYLFRWGLETAGLAATFTKGGGQVAMTLVASSGEVSIWVGFEPDSTSTNSVIWTTTSGAAFSTSAVSVSGSITSGTADVAYETNTATGTSTRVSNTSTPITTSAYLFMFYRTATGTHGGNPAAFTVISDHGINGCALGETHPTTASTPVEQAVDTNSAAWVSISVEVPVAVAAGPANLKTWNTNVKENIKSINTNLIANVKTLDTNV